MPVPETVTSLASQHFLNPIGLLALLGLVPLLIFYLIKPKPEEQVMPSMMFFMQRESKGKVSHALRKFMHNFLLLLHILLIVGLAASIAQPQIAGIQKPDNTVVVFDVSASMSDDMDQAQSFATSNLGESNTLIVAGQDVSIPLEDASASQVRRHINNLESQDVETDVAAGLETVQDYQGQVVVVSDLDQTVNSRDVEPMAKELQQNRDVKLFEAEDRNSWGIVDVEPGKPNSTIDVKNFQEEGSEVLVRVGESGRRINVDAGSVETVTIETEPGINTVELGDDGMEADNTAYISIPGEEHFNVTYIADQPNPYMEKAADLISFTTLETKRPPINEELNSDIYIIGETDRLTNEKGKEISSQVKNGTGLVVFAQDGLADKGVEPAPKFGDSRDTSVEILQPVRASIGETRVYSFENEEYESLSTPREAIMKKSHGEGEVAIYNIDDRDFRHNFMYPIFWKNMFADLSEKPSINDLNIETGDTLNSPRIVKPNGEEVSGRITLTESGYYNTSEGTYAVNLESEDESNVDEVNINSNSIDPGETQQNAQHLAAILIALLVVLELIYLMWIGEA